MSPHTLAILITLLLATVSAGGDFFLKLASREINPFANRWFVLGLLIFSATSFSWVFVMKHVKLAVVGGLFSVSLTILLALTGYFYFNERIVATEWLGLLLAVASLVLLGRVAG